MDIESIQAMQDYGILGLIIVQISSIIRTWLTVRKTRKQNTNIGVTMLDMRKEIAAIKKTNKEEHFLLEQSYKRIDERIEDNRFIPAYEINIDTYLNQIIQGYSFNKEELQGVAMSLAEKSIDIFVKILKVGFIKYKHQSVIDMFDSQLIMLKNLIVTHNIKSPEKIKKIITHAQEGFLIYIQKIMNEKTNGKRQEAFEALTEKFLFNLIKEISVL